LEDECDVLEVEIEQQALEISVVLGGGIAPILRRLALSETHVVGHDDTPEFGERRDEVSIEISPGWLSMNAHKGFARVARALVDKVLLKSAP
jgi:hypothetical protein